MKKKEENNMCVVSIENDGERKNTANFLSQEDVNKLLKVNPNVPVASQEEVLKIKSELEELEAKNEQIGISESMLRNIMRYNMKKRYIILAIVILLSMSMSSCQTSKRDEISSYKSSGDFCLTLYADKGIYKKNDEIRLWASLEYKGINDSITLWHSNPFINFHIKSKSDSFAWEPINDAFLGYTTINKNNKRIVYFPKQISITKEQIEAMKDEKMKKFVQDPKLHLPKGIYEVKVIMQFSTSQDSKDPIKLETNLNIEVED